jgi:nitroreductase
MDAINNIFSRRSIRRYRPDPVTPESIRTVIEAAMFAPSSADQEPWRFVVIEDKETIKTISVEHPYATFLTQCPVVILVCGATKDLHHGAFWTDDCAAATQNMLLAAHALGLGSIWIGIHPIEERMNMMRRLANLPEGVEPFALIPLGYAAETPEQPDRYHSEWIRSESWLTSWTPGVRTEKPKTFPG